MKIKKVVNCLFVFMGFVSFLILVNCGDQNESKRTNVSSQNQTHKNQHENDANAEVHDSALESENATPAATITPTPETDTTPETDSSDSGGNSELEPLQLTSEQNFILKDVDEKATTLTDYFKGKYLVLDLSSSSCGACISLAQEKDRETEFQKMFEPGKCTFAVLVTNRDLRSWLNNFSEGGFLSTHSFAVDLSQQAMAKAFGFTLEYIPSILFIDRKGNLVQSDVGQIPSRVNELCK